MSLLGVWATQSLEPISPLNRDRSGLRTRGTRPVLPEFWDNSRQSKLVYEATRDSARILALFTLLSPAATAMKPKAMIFGWERRERKDGVASHLPLPRPPRPPLPPPLPPRFAPGPLLARS